MGMYWRTFHHKNKFIQRLTLSRFVTATTVSGGYIIMHISIVDGGRKPSYFYQGLSG